MLNYCIYQCPEPVQLILKPAIAILNYCCQSTLTILKSYKISRGVNIV